MASTSSQLQNFYKLMNRQNIYELNRIKKKSKEEIERRELIERETEQLKQIHQNMTGMVSYFPIEFTMDMLSRLPAKDLCHCRWVCKSWYDLISHPRFMLLQHNKAIHSKIWSSLIHCDSMGDRYMLDHQSLVNSPQTLRPLYSFKRDFHEIVGSSNGLVCMRSSKPCYHVINPITRDRISVPQSIKSSSTNHFASGFGFDQTINDYKLVRIMINKSRRFEAEVYTLGSGCCWRSIDKRKQLKDEVYNLGSGCCWRSIDEVPYFFMGSTMGVTNNVFVAGALHWLGYKPGELGMEKINVVISFDMSTEEFGDIPLPSNARYVMGAECCYFYLGVLRDCLCFLDGFNNDHPTEVWVLKEYGAEVSWTKQFTIRKDLMAGHIGMLYDSIKFRQNDELLLLFNNKGLGYYDPQTGKFRPISVRGINALSSYMFPIAHVDSLISPKNIARIKMRDELRTREGNKDHYLQSKAVGGC